MPGTRRTMKATWLKKQQLFPELLPSVERNWEKCCGSAPSTGLHCPPVPLWASLTRIILETEPWKYRFLDSPWESDQGKDGEWVWEQTVKQLAQSPFFATQNLFSHSYPYLFPKQYQLYVSIIHTDKDSHPPMTRRQSYNSHSKVHICPFQGLELPGDTVIPFRIRCGSSWSGHL